MHHTFGEPRRHTFSLLSNPIPRLLLKSAILMPSAKKDDVNIVQIESEGYNKEKVLFSLMYQIILENIFNEHDAREDECKHFYIDDACLVRVGADLLGNAESDTVLLHDYYILPR